MSYKRGGFADLWLADSVARARDLADSFEDPSLNESEAKDWYFDHARNILFAVYATETGDPEDPSLNKASRCLRTA